MAAAKRAIADARWFAQKAGGVEAVGRKSMGAIGVEHELADEAAARGERDERKRADPPRAERSRQMLPTPASSTDCSR